MRAIWSIFETKNKTKQLSQIKGVKDRIGGTQTEIKERLLWPPFFLFYWDRNSDSSSGSLTVTQVGDFALVSLLADEPGSLGSGWITLQSPGCKHGNGNSGQNISPGCGFSVGLSLFGPCASAVQALLPAQMIFKLFRGTLEMAEKWTAFNVLMAARHTD